MPKAGPAHVKKTEDKGKTQCKQEIEAFIRGGKGGANRLREILPSLFSYYKVLTAEAKVLLLDDCGLSPYIDSNSGQVTFFLSREDVDDHFKPPPHMKRQRDVLVCSAEKEIRSTSPDFLDHSLDMADPE
jgi:hypothetical protein